MLDKIRTILEECEKRSYQARVYVSVHHTVDGNKVQFAEAHEFAQCLKETFGGGRIKEFVQSIGWSDKEYCESLECSIFYAKPIVEVPVDEYNQMKQELERYRAESSSLEQ